MNVRKWSLVVLFLATPNLFAADNAKEAAAKQSAIEWLALVDQGAYEASWKDASSLFRSKIASEKWVEAVKSVRAPLGAVSDRRFVSATYATQLPGAPDGEYVVLQFRTKFATKDGAIETVTPMLDGGQWKVSGYYVR
jgi:hypothetical protein